jgi:hypothetical protein
MATLQELNRLGVGFASLDAALDQTPSGSHHNPILASLETFERKVCGKVLAEVCEFCSGWISRDPCGARAMIPHCEVITRRPSR